MFKIGDVIEGKKDVNVDFEANEIAAFKNAPMVSVEVERVFSQIKAMFRENRSSFCFNNFKEHLIINCNKCL